MTNETMWPDVEVADWNFFISRVAKTVGSGITPPTYLFRGQPDATRPLVPTLLRNFPPDFTAEQALAIEEAALDDFQSQAHLHYSQGSLPSEDGSSLCNWWALMQHHGAPTRLLDWTSSPYVAAYFACQSSDDQPGAIFVAYPAASEAVFTNSFPTKDVSNHALLNPAAPHLLVFPDPHKHTARLVAQQGHFSVSVNILGRHDQLMADAVRPLALANPEGIFLNRLLIPAEQKLEFLKHLRVMNVTANALFPGIDGLGRSVGETVRLKTRKMEQKAHNIQQRVIES